MKGLYSEQEVVTVNYSLESFIALSSTSSVIAQEAISDYLFKVKDMFSNTYSSLTGEYNDKMTAYTLDSKYEIANRVRRLNFADIKEHTISKPDGFDGKFVDYLNDLITVSEKQVTSAIRTLESLKMSVSGFINEYSDNKLVTLYNARLYPEVSKEIEKDTKRISSYFTSKTGSVKFKMKDGIRNLADIDHLFKGLTELDRVINQEQLKRITALSKEVSDLVDILLEQNTKSNILTNNSEVKKELINAIYIAAKQVEFVSYLYANAMVFQGSVTNLLEDIKTLSDM